MELKNTELKSPRYYEDVRRIEISYCKPTTREFHKPTYVKGTLKPIKTFLPFNTKLEEIKEDVYYYSTYCGKPIKCNVYEYAEKYNYLMVVDGKLWDKGRVYVEFTNKEWNRVYYFETNKELNEFVEEIKENCKKVKNNLE